MRAWLGCILLSRKGIELWRRYRRISTGEPRLNGMEILTFIMDATERLLALIFEKEQEE